MRKVDGAPLRGIRQEYWGSIGDIPDSSRGLRGLGDWKRALVQRALVPDGLLPLSIAGALPRDAAAACCDYVINRGNKRREVFHHSSDYAEFLAVMAEASQRQAVRRSVVRGTPFGSAIGTQPTARILRLE